MVWPRVRAGCIALVIAVGLLDGLAIPEGRGLERLPPSLQGAAKLGSRIRATLLSPFLSLKEAFLYDQRWSLFGGAKDARHRLWIEGRVGRRWTLLYRPHDPDHRWLADALEYRRVRAAWNAGRKGRTRGYDAFTAWISQRAFRERDDLSAVRVRLEEGVIAPRGGGFQPSRHFVLGTTHERKERR